MDWPRLRDWADGQVKGKRENREIANVAAAMWEAMFRGQMTC